MKRYFFIIVIAAVLTATGGAPGSQTLVNPDISFIGDTRLEASRNAPEDSGVGDVRVDFHELEIAGTGYLNPFSRADIFLGIHGVEGPIEIEEAYATILRGLPFNLQLKAGQYLVDYGKLNSQHPHLWSWMVRPLMHEFFFGDDGLKDVGINVSTFLPLGSSAVTLSGNFLQGDFFASPHGQNEGEGGVEEDNQIAADNDPGTCGRVSIFSPLTDITSLELGFSGLYGQHDPEDDLWTLLGSFDLKLRWRPDMYRSLTLVAETQVGSRTIPARQLPGLIGDERVRSYGLFAAVDYQFRRRYNLGAFVDYAQEPDKSDAGHFGVGLFCGFSMAEETYRIGFLIRHNDNPDLAEGYQTATLQFLWSLGPHKPHVY